MSYFLAMPFNLHHAFTATGAGLGSGIGFVQGYNSDDPTKSWEHHVLRGLGHGVVGGTLGGGLGFGASHLFKKTFPKSFHSVKEDRTPTRVL